MRKEWNGNEENEHFRLFLPMICMLLFLVLLGLSGCGAISENKSAESIAVQPTNNKLAIGKTQQFKLMSSYTGDMSSSVVWNSSLPSIAPITANGMVTAVAAGETIISATKNGVTYTTVLTVPANPPVFGNISGAHSSPTGVWDGTYTIYDAVDVTEIGTYKFKLDLNQSGTSISGTSSLRYDIPARKADGTITEGNVNDSVINFVFKYIDPRTSYEMVDIGSAVITGTSMTGEVLENHKNGWNCSYSFNVNKQ